MSRSVLLAISASSIFVLAMSDGARSQECESIIALSRTISTVVSDKNEVEQHASNFCNEYSKAKQSGSAMNLGASYKFLSGTLGTSSSSAESVASRYCSASNSSKAASDSFKQYVEAIAPDAFASYESCLRLAKQDVKFKVDTASVLPTDLLIVASFVSSVSGSKSARLAYSSSSGVTCNWVDRGAQAEIEVTTGSTVRLKCTRSQGNQESYISIVRSDGTPDPLTLRWKKYNSDGVPIDTVASLVKKISELEIGLQGVSSEAVRQCRVQMEAKWGNCDGAQNGDRMPPVQSSLTPVKGGWSEWSGWQHASAWNGGPYNCIRARLYCK